MPSVVCRQAIANATKPDVLQPIIAAAAAVEHQKRRQALEITFLSSKRPTTALGSTPSDATAAEPSSTAVAASAAAAAAAAGSSTDDAAGQDPDDDDSSSQGEGEGEGFEGGYSMDTRQRIAEAPDDIAAALGVPRARYVQLFQVYLLIFAPCSAGHRPGYSQVAL